MLPPISAVWPELCVKLLSNSSVPCWDSTLPWLVTPSDRVDVTLPPLFRRTPALDMVKVPAGWPLALESRTASPLIRKRDPARLLMAVLELLERSALQMPVPLQ